MKAVITSQTQIWPMAIFNLRATQLRFHVLSGGKEKLRWLRENITFELFSSEFAYWTQKVEL